MNLGPAIKYYRERLGLTRAELAARADTSPAMVEHWESGRRGISITKLHEVANSLGIQLWVLIIKAEQT